MSLPRVYARALWGVSSSSQGEVAQELGAFFSAVHSDAMLRVALFGPVVSSSEKVRILRPILEKCGQGAIAQNFLILLAKKGRLDLLGDILSAYEDVRWEAVGGVRGVVRSAEPLSESDLSGLAEAFSTRLNKKISFRTETDPSLLAGLSVTLQGVTYDGTLRSQLSRLRERVSSMQ